MIHEILHQILAALLARNGISENVAALRIGKRAVWRVKETNKGGLDLTVVLTRTKNLNMDLFHKKHLLIGEIPVAYPKTNRRGLGETSRQMGSKSTRYNKEDGKEER